MSENKADIPQQLAALRADYAARLPGKIRELEKLWKRLCRHGWDTGALMNLHRLAHTLAGTGGTFGVPAVSKAASILERTLKGLTETGKPAGETEKVLITDQLRTLQTLATGPIGSSGGEIISPPEPSEEPTGHKQRVYIFGNDARFNDGLAQQIEHIGYEVKTFTQAEDFEQTTKRAVPAAIIMDAPSSHKASDGLQALQRIQRRRGDPVPVIFFSDASDMVQRLEAVRAGGIACLDKPVDIGALINKLDRLTGQRKHEPFRVLIIDDYAPQARHYALTLQQAGMITATVNDPMQIMRPLVEFSPDIILMDMYMPECNGVELAKLIRQQEAYVSIPIVFFSTEQNIDKQLSAMKEGADDFLTKPIRPEHLISSVTTRAERSRILRSFMERDGLTGLFNHTKIKEQLELELGDTRRHNTILAYAMLDIDNFKSINDNYGHAAGDRVIKSLAHLLQQRLRTGDVIGRYGGEEFAIILPGTTAQDAFRVLDQLRENFHGLQHSCKGTVFSASYSCGIATYPEYADINRISDAADQALYQAKREGKNRVVLSHR